MKRILSTLIAVVMVVSVMAFMPLTSNALPAGTAHTLDANNVGFEVPYFSGTTTFYRISGKVTDPSTRKSIVEVGPINHAVKTGEGELYLDGVIDEGEWGIPIIEVDSRYAAERWTTTPSAENTYFWWSDPKRDTDGKSDNTTGQAAHDKGVSYKVWMAWDQDYLYIAAEVKDPDNLFSTQDGLDKETKDPLIWNGDALQFIIDPQGPNSVAGGEGYDASVNSRPWKYPEKLRKNSNTGNIANIGTAYCTSGNTGYPGIWDLATRYYPERVEHLDASGNVDSTSIDWVTYDVNYLNYIRGSVAAPNEIMGRDANNNPYYAYSAILQENAGTNTNPDYTTTYELAIPWTLVGGSHYEYDEETDERTFVPVAYTPEAGDEYGFSMVLLNGARGKTNYNSWLTWGSGVCGAQTENSTDFPTAGGSNSMLLVSDELGTTGCEHEFANPTCSAPYVCTKCGYRKGFATGHNYVSELVTPLAANQDGLIRSTCQYPNCGKVVETVVPAVDQVTQFEFDDTFTVGALSESSEWNAENWNFSYNDDEGNPIYLPNGKQKRTYSEYEEKMVFDLTDGEAGTYFSARHDQSSFSYEYDFRLTGIDYETAYGDEAYSNTTYVYGLYNWFGGRQPKSGGGYDYGMNYAAGFFTETQGTTTGKFKIVDAIGLVALPSQGRDQKVYAETDEIDLGTGWHHVVFVYDAEAGAAFYYLDGECILAAWDEGMIIPDGGKQVPIMRRFDTSCMIKGLGIGSTTAFLEDADIPEPTGYTVKCDGELIGEYDAGDVVELPVPAFDDSTGKPLRFYTWEGAEVQRSNYNKNTATANGRKYTLVMPAENVELTSSWSYVSDVNGDNRINTRDLVEMKKIISGNITPGAAEMDRADINCDGRIGSPDVSAIKKIFASNYTITK